MMFPEQPSLLRKQSLLSIWWLYWLLLLPVTGWADNHNTDAPSLSDYTREMEQVEKRFKNNPANVELLQQIGKTSLATSNYAQKCLTDYEARLVKVDESVTTLGSVGNVDSSIPNEAALQHRTALDKQKKDIEETLAQCRLLSVRAKDLMDQTHQTEQNLLKARLFARNPSVLNSVQSTLSQPSTLQQEWLEITQAFKNLPINAVNLYTALLYGVAGLLIGGLWSLYKRRTPEIQASVLAQTSPALATIWNSITRAAPGLLLFGLISLSFLFSPVGMPTINDLAMTFLTFMVSYTILSAMLKPYGNLYGFNALLPRARHKLFFWGSLLALTTLLAVLFQSVIFDTVPPNNLLGLTRITLGTLVGLALMRVLWLLRKHISPVKRLRLHLLSLATILVATGALWGGYSNFSAFLFQGVFGTLFILLGGWLLFQVPLEVFDSMDEGTANWQQQLRRKMDLEKGQIIPGLIWLRLAHTLVIGSLVIIALLRLWGMSEQSFNLMLSHLVNGYSIGGFTLEPLSVLSGFLFLSFGILLTQFIKRSLSQNWLRRTNLSQGAKEATVTIVGYTGVALAFFIGLSAVGVNFSNLAIVAGALSVGIGFGLQNIVSNFISGLILLFERPIRRGDWIRAGHAEGYVKKISIRSTVISSFDRSDIIVPNSELISNQVTNMMLNDQAGRIVIPVQAAYGTNIKKVIDTLQEVAEIHPSILHEQGKPKIQAVCRRFGDSGIDFELRCHINDVESALVVTSELIQGIDEAFRKAEIEIPFPHQVVYLKQEAASE